MRSTFDEPGDLALNEDEDDIVFDEGVDALAQQIALGILCLRGTWTWDLNEGFPLLQLTFVSQTQLGAAYEELRTYLESFPDVKSVDELIIQPQQIDGRQVANVQFTLSTTFGALSTKDIYLPDFQL